MPVVNEDNVNFFPLIPGFEKLDGVLLTESLMRGVRDKFRRRIQIHRPQMPVIHFGCRQQRLGGMPLSYPEFHKCFALRCQCDGENGNDVPVGIFLAKERLVAKSFDGVLG